MCMKITITQRNLYCFRHKSVQINKVAFEVFRNSKLPDKLPGWQPESEYNVECVLQNNT